MVHVAYIIARIIPDGGTNAVYRCIGAWHEPWIYGRLPLHAARRFLTLIRQPDNAEIIREELRSISGKYDNHTKLNRRVPCPYSTFLLASAFCLGFDDDRGAVHASGYGFKNSVGYAFKHPYYKGDEDNGITVIDITDPGNPSSSYCFASLGGLDTHDEDECPTHVPLTADDYCRAYYPETDSPDDNRSVREEDVQGDIDSMANETVMGCTPLKETWAKEFRNDTTTASQEQETTSNSLPSLVDLTLKVAVKQVINSGDVETIYPILLVPGKYSSIRGILQEFDPLPPAAVQIFMTLNQRNIDSPDLSYLNLRPEDVMTVLSRYSGTKLAYLNLSHNSHVTADLLCTIIKGHPHIRRIVLFGTSITDEDMDSLLVSNPRLCYHIDQVIHPAYLSFTARTSRPRPFSFFGWTGMWGRNILSIPFFNPTAVVHCINRYMSILMQELDNDPDGHLMHSNISAMAIFSDTSVGTHEQPDRTWSQRSVGFIPTSGPFEGPADAFSNNHKGWVFVIRNRPLFEDSQYSFVHRVPSQGDEDPTLSIHDLDSFLCLLKKDYGAEPDIGVVEKLRETLDRAKVSLNATLLTSDELDSTVPKLGSKMYRTTSSTQTTILMGTYINRVYKIQYPKNIASIQY